MQQAFYFFSNGVYINGETIDSEDWVGAFKGDDCVGAKQWDISLCGSGICEVTVMGNDGTPYTANYMISGEIPSLPMTVTSHIPLPHKEISHCFAPTQSSPLKAPTQSSESIVSPLI
jgi:hypothetical protein